jgi:small-conductance mechanosensitive channel
LSLVSALMPATFWGDHADKVEALGALALACVVAFLVDRALAKRGHRIAEAVMRGELSPEADTRLRFLRRLIYALIVLMGVAIVVETFLGVHNLARTLLTSGAILAAVVGFAARQTLANVIAGIMLAITQPLRVGDWVTFEDQYGVVEDVRLNYTFLRTSSDQRIVIPNERLAAGILSNDTLGSNAIGLEVAIWLQPEVDVDSAVKALADESGRDVLVAESTADGVRLSVSGEPVAPPDKARHESDLRQRCLRRLRNEGLQGA